MNWRQAILDTVAPGMMGGMSTGDWLRLLAENRFRVSPRFWPRAAAATACTFVHTGAKWIEHARYARRVAAQPFEPPLFILGHHRSGTTHLQNLFGVDNRFACPAMSDVTMPHALLTLQPVFRLTARIILPPTRLGVDNMKADAGIPTEEEVLLMLTTFQSPFMGFIFPRRAEHYHRYLAFDDVPPDEIDRWKRAFIWFTRKLTFRYGRPLVFRSSPHTARIRLLLETFPGARFVHIRRNPFDVYRSTQRLLGRLSKLVALQTYDAAERHAWIVRTYRRMYDAYFEQRPLIPRGRFTEVAFENLERDPVGEMRRVYNELSLPAFDEAEPALRAYVDSLAGYRKNEHPELPADLRNEITDAWRPSFLRWGYAT